MKHTQPIVFLLSVMLTVWCCNVSAQPMRSYQDTPTPVEMAVHNQPYIILQREIENNLCDKNWGIDTLDKNGNYVAPFLILKGDPNDDVILRGSTVHFFIPVNRGTECTVQLKNTSPLYKANSDSMLAQTEISKSQFGIASQLFAKAAKNNYKYTHEDSVVMDKMKIVSDKVNKEMDHLSNALKLATIGLVLNSHWTEPQMGRQYYLDGGTNFDGGKLLPTIEGASFATLFWEDPWKLDPDILWEATIYIGKWPVITDLKKRFAFHFMHIDKTPWTDKQHSGKPVIENMKIIIMAEDHGRLLKVIHSIDWTKLNALVKE